MPHIILDVNFPTHPKVVRVSPLAQLLHIRAMLYSCQHLTDGKLHRPIIAMLGYDLGDVRALTAELMEVRLWHERADHIEINGFLDFQFSKKEVEARRTQKRAAGQAGGQASAQARAQADAQAPARRGASTTDTPEGKQKATPISDIRCPISDVRSPMTDDLPPISDIRGRRKSCSGDTAAAPKSNAVWDSYSAAYQVRYGIEPVRNAKANAQLCQLIDRLGAEEAPHVSAFYVTHNKPFYVTHRHPVNLLLQDAEGLRTQWATGVKSTTREAQSAEQRDNVVSQVDRVRAQLQGGR